MKLKKCIGIISGFSDNVRLQNRRIKHFEKLLAFFDNYWADLDILIIAQNWKNYQPPKIKNKLIIKYYPELLGITQARQELRREFLKYDYDYIIMFDDDAIIHIDNESLPQEYLNEIDKHPNGFCLIHSDAHWRHNDDIARSPLNLFALCRELYEKEDIPNVYPEKNEAMEDDVYVTIFHVIYADREFYPPKGIRHAHSYKLMYIKHFTDPTISPPIWFEFPKFDFHTWWHNTAYIIDYIEANKKLDLEEIKLNPRWYKPGQRWPN